MATPKLQNAYRNASTQTDDIANLLLVTTSGLSTDADAGASYIVFHDGSNDVLMSSAAPLPVVAAATDALLGTIDADTGAIATSAASIDGKTPALGQALAAASVPVVLTAAQLSTLTPPAAITGFALESGGNLAAIATDAAAIETLLTTIEGNQLPDGHNVTIANASIAVTAAALPLPDGAATLAEQQTQTTSLGRLAGKYVDFDTSGGTDSVVAFGLLLPGNGGAVIGGTSSNPIRVDVTGSTTQPVSAASLPLPSNAAQETGGNLAAIAGSLNVMDDWDESDRAKVNPIAGQAGVQGGSGAVSANTQRVVLATDVALPSGSNTIGGVNLTQYTPASGRLPVDGSGVTQPVSGTVTVDAGTNTSTAALALESGGNLESLAGATYTDGTTIPTRMMLIGAYDDGDTNTVRALRYDPTNQCLLVSIAGTANPLGVWGASDHDQASSGVGPILMGGYASAAAPTDVSADNDAVRAWHLRNGSQVCNLAVGGTLVTASAGLPVAGGVAHDGVDSGAPNKVGMKAIAHGTNPTAVAAADRSDVYCNRAGIPFVIGGHPNVITVSARILDSDGAQTNVALVTVSSGTKIVVTRVSVKADGSNSGPVNCTVGFATATLATPGTTSGAGILLDHQGISAGGGSVEGNGSGILGVGADGEDLRYTCEDPAGGALTISVSYYTIES